MTFKVWQRSSLMKRKENHATVFINGPLMFTTIPHECLQLDGMSVTFYGSNKKRVVSIDRQKSTGTFHKEFKPLKLGTDKEKEIGLIHFFLLF